MQRKIDIDWIDPGGFALQAYFAEIQQQGRWQMAAYDLVHPSQPSDQSRQHRTYSLEGQALLPACHTVLTAGVVQPLGAGGASGLPAAPRSVVVTVCSPAAQDADGSRERLFIWVVDVWRCVFPSATIQPSQFAGSRPAANEDMESISLAQAPKIALREALSMPLLEDTPFGFLGVGALGSISSKGNGLRGCGGGGHGDPSAQRCVLAHRGAWVALQPSSTRVLMVEFEPALAPLRPGMAGQTAPNQEEDTLAALSATAVAPRAAAPPGDGAPAEMQYVDLDLSAAAPRGGSVLSCWGGAKSVVLDVAVPATSAAAPAAIDYGYIEHDDSDNIDDDNDGSGRGHSVLLRLSFPLAAATPTDPSVPDADGAPGGGAAAAAAVKGTAGRAARPAALVACVRLRGDISTCCPLPRLAYRRRKAPAGGPGVPTGAAEAQCAPALETALTEALLPVMVGSSSGGVSLVVPRGRGWEAAAGAVVPTRGTAQRPRNGMAGLGAAGAWRTEDGPPRAPLPALEVAAHISLPGPVDTIQPLPRIHTANGATDGESRRSDTGDGGFGRGGGVGGADWAQHWDRGWMVFDGQESCAPVTAAASPTAFAAALCGDAARSLTVFRAIRHRHPQPYQGRPSHAHAAAGHPPPATAGPWTGTGPWSWSLQRLLVLPGVHALLPVPVPSALSLALAPCGADGAGTSGGRSGVSGSGGVADASGAVLASVAAIVVLGAPGSPDSGDGDDARMRDALGADEEMEDGEGYAAGGHEVNGDGAWGDVYTQRPQHQQHRCQNQYQDRQLDWRQNLRGEAEHGLGGVDARGGRARADGGGGAGTALGPLGLGPWRRAMVVPAEVQALPPQALLSLGEEGGAAAATAAGAVATATAMAAASFAGGIVSRVLRVEGPVAHAARNPRCPEPQRGGTGGGGGGCDGSSAQQAGMAKMLAHIARRWDTGVQHALEQRAALSRMLHLTNQAERLIAEAGQRPLRPTHGSAAARPPVRAALLDPLLDLEDGLMLLQGQQQRHSRVAQVMAGTSGVVDGTGCGCGVAAEDAGAMDRLLDRLLGDGAAATAPTPPQPPALTRGTADGVVATRGRGGTVAAAALPAAAGGGPDGPTCCQSAGSSQQPGCGGSWCLALESLVQGRQGDDFVVQAILRLDGCGGGDDGDAAAYAAVDASMGAISPLQLDDVALLLHCPAGLAMTNMRSRWAVLQRARRRVAVEAAVPMGELMGLAAAAAAAAAAQGECGSGSDGLDPESLRRRDLETALGPLPVLFDASHGSADGDGDTDASTCCSCTDSEEDSVNAAGGADAAFNVKAVGVPYGGSDGLALVDGGCRGSGRTRVLQLAAVVRVTARAEGLRGGGGYGSHIGGRRDGGIAPCEAVSAVSLLQARVLDLGLVSISLDDLLLYKNDPERQLLHSLESHGVSRGAGFRTASGCGDEGKTSKALHPLGMLLRPSRSMMLVATAGGPWAAAAGGSGAAAVGGVGPTVSEPPCAAWAWSRPEPSWGTGGGGGVQPGESADSGGMSRALQARLLSMPGFSSAGAHQQAAVSARTGERADKPGGGDDIAGRELSWEGPMGWRCSVAMTPYGVYGCEVDMSYLGGGGGGGDGWAGAALDELQWLLTRAAEQWCGQVRRRLSALCPNPLASPQLERLDVAASSMERCVTATLQLLEQTLLAQQQQQKQRQHGQRWEQQQQGQAPRRPGSHTALQDSTCGDGSELAVPAASTGGGANLQAMLHEVLQLQLQLNAAVETYLT